MPTYEQYCEKCGQGVHMPNSEGKCIICGHDGFKFVKKHRQHYEKTEKLGIFELLDN